MFFDIENVKGTITNLNPRPENKGKKEKELAYDINVKMEISIGILDKLAVNEKLNYSEFFFDKKGEVRHTGIESLVFNREFDEHWLIVDMDLVTEQRETFGPLKLKKFKATPVFGHRVILTFQAQCKPRDEELVFINKALIKQEVLISTRVPDQIDLEEVTKAEE